MRREFRSNTTTVTRMKSYENIEDFFKDMDEEWANIPWYKKAWEIMYYVVGDMWSFLLHDLPYGFRNLWHFKGVIFKFRSWDFQYNLDILARSLELTRSTIVTDPHRYDQQSGTYANAMSRVIEIINAGEFEDENWNELWTILRGSGNPSHVIVVRDGEDDVELNITDGTDMRSWWT